MESIALNQNADRDSNNAQLGEADEGTKNMLLSNICYFATQNIHGDLLLRYRTIEKQRLEEIDAINTKSRRQSKVIYKQTNQKLQDFEKERNFELQKLNKECDEERDRCLLVGRIQMIQSMRDVCERHIASLVLRHNEELKAVGDEYKQGMKEKHDRIIQQTRDDTERRIQIVNRMTPSESRRRDLTEWSQITRQQRKNRLIMRWNRQKNRVTCIYRHEIRKHYEACGRKIQAIYLKCKEQIQEIDQNYERNIQEKYAEFCVPVKQHKECGRRKRERCEELNEQLKEIHSTNQRIQRVYDKYGWRLKKLRRDYFRKIEFGLGGIPARNKYEERNFEISVLHHKCSERLRVILENYDKNIKKPRLSVNEGIDIQ